MKGVDIEKIKEEKDLGIIDAELKFDSHCLAVVIQLLGLVRKRVYGDVYQCISLPIFGSRI